MTEPHYYNFLMSMLAVLTLGLDACVILSCSGDSVRLFERIQVNDSDTIVSLYIKRDNNEKNNMIASWSNKSSKSVQRNVILDENNNIWILNVGTFDEANYTLLTLLYGKDSKKQQAQLTVMTAPAANCKPKIKRIENVLKATLDGGDCGKPIASLHWQKQFGVNYEGKDLATLPPGRKTGIYYACMDGPALRCARSSHPSLDHCTPFTIEDSSTESDNGVSVDTFTSMMHISFGLHAVQIIGLSAVAAILLCQKCISRLNIHRPADTTAVNDSERSSLVLNTRNQENTSVGGSGNVHR